MVIADIVSTFRDEWPLLLSIPFTAAFVGWITKVLALRMMFAPLRFVGVGPIGWQGMVPRRTAKFATIAADALLGHLIDPRALLDEIDTQELVDRLAPQLEAMTDEVAREFLAQYHSELWDALPDAAQQLVLSRVIARAPEIVAGLLADVREDIDTIFDPRYAVIEHMVRNKELMVGMMRSIATPELGFMVRMGTIFGFAIGTVQMFTWAATHDHIVLPLFGGFVGLFSDWIALQMIFVPRRPKRFLGLFPWHGLFFRRRVELSRAYARVAAEGMISPAVILRAFIEGPQGDRLFALIAREAEHALLAEERIARPALDLAVGSGRYQAVRRAVIERSRAVADSLQPEIAAYTGETFDIERIVADAMIAMDEDEYESILRPMFKDDEWVVVAVGGALGVLVGELQVLLLTSPLVA